MMKPAASEGQKMDAEQITREIEWEKEAISFGVERFKAQVYGNGAPLPWRSDPVRQRPVETTAPAVAASDVAFRRISEIIVDYVVAGSAGEAGRMATVWALLAQFDPEQLAYVAARVAIAAGLGNLSVAAAASMAVDMLTQHAAFKDGRKSSPEMTRRLSAVLRKRGATERRTEAVMKRLEEAGVHIIRWSRADQVRIGAVLMEAATEAGVVKLVQGRVKRQDARRVRLIPEVADWMTERLDRMGLAMPIRLPMIVPPKPWTGPTKGGFVKLRNRFVRGTNARQAEALQDADLSRVFETANHLQSVAWEVNEPVLQAALDLWKAGGGRAGLPVRERRRPDPRPEGAPGDPVYDEWRKTAAAVYDREARSLSRRMAVSQDLWLAGRLKQEGRFYFVHEVDKRGRFYPAVSGGPTPQGDDLQKALIRFAEGKPLGKSGGYWLAIHLANSYGVDKVPFAERVQWVFDNEDAILASAADPIAERFWQDADAPFQFLAAAVEWAGYVREGEDFISHIPVAVDGSNSGLQHFSAMLLDPVGGRAVNLLPADRPQDIYKEVASVLQGRVDASAEPDAAPWKGEKITRSIAKRPVMTYVYSATRYGMTDQVRKEVEGIDDRNAGLGLPPHLGDADKHSASVWLAGELYGAIGAVVQKADEAMAWLKDAAKIAAEAGEALAWTAPNGFPVVNWYEKPTMKGGGKGQGQVELILGGRRVKISAAAAASRTIDPAPMRNGIAPNFIHSFDAAHLSATVNAFMATPGRSMAAIHDSFGSHAADLPALNLALRQEFIRQYTPGWLADIGDAWTERHPDIPPPPTRGSLDLQQVADSAYLFA
jgi:DNA-directed RNA polymerase, mitochondrial